MAGFGEWEANGKSLNIESSPKTGPQLLEEAVKLHKEGQITQAEKLYVQAIEAGFHHEIAFSNLGVIYKHTNRLREAKEIYKLAVLSNPQFADAHSNLGSLLKGEGQLDKALESTLKAVEIKPNNPDTQMNLGGIYMDLGQLDQALSSTLKSLELKPDNPTAHMNLGGIYMDLGQFDQALSSTLKSLELRPDNSSAQINLGSIYINLGQLDKALAATLKSLELKPDNPDAQTNLGIIYQAKGELEESAQSLQKALALNPQPSGALYISSMNLQDVNAAYSLLEKIEQVDQNSLPLRDKLKITFAKTNCFHRIKDYKNATNLLKQANELKLLCMPSDAAVLIKDIEAIANTLTASEVPTSKQYCDQIFIVGVPRSGSTLLSTILNTNRLVKDLGESKALPQAIRAYSCQGAISKRKNLGDFYATYIDEAIPPGSITVDKQLFNFIYCHHIANCLPGAKIIHATRNPLDNILSMLRANLMAGNNYTASAEDSAMVIIEQEKLMRVYKKLFPNKIYTYSYDRLVNDPQTETRKLLGWVGLNWNEYYLDFHKTKQVIKTASVMQARQPISNKSVGGWKNYCSILEPARQLLLESNLFSAESLSIH